MLPTANIRDEIFISLSIATNKIQKYYFIVMKMFVKNAFFYCKCCGQEFQNLRALTSYLCNRSDTGKHQLFEGDDSDIYLCEYCGTEFRNLRTLCAYNCIKSPNGKHIPYEGRIRQSYSCKYCGRDFNNMKTLCAYICNKSPTGNHFPAR